MTSTNITVSGSSTITTTTAAGGAVVSNEGTLLVRWGRTLADDISISTYGSTYGHDGWYGAIRSEDSANTLTGQITVAGTSRIHVNPSSVTITGQVTGGGALDKQGDGTLILTNATNNFSGMLTIGAGVVRVTSEAQLGAPASVVRPSGGTLELNGAFDLNAKALSLGGGGASYEGEKHYLFSGFTSLAGPNNVTFDLSDVPLWEQFSTNLMLGIDDGGVYITGLLTVPEPATLTVLALGGIAILLRRRKRTR